MLTVLACIASIALMSMGNRLRGGLYGPFFPWGDTVSRLLWWGGSTAIAAFLLGAPWYLALLLIPAQWATATIPLFSSIGLGHGDPADFTRDFLFLTLRGFLGSIGVAAVLLGVNHFTGTDHLWEPVLALGTLEAVGYYVGWQRGLPVVDNGYNGPTEIGELIYGALIAVGLIIGLLV